MTPQATLRMELSLRRIVNGVPVPNGHVAVTVVLGTESTDWAASLADAAKFTLAQIATHEPLATDGTRATDGAPDGSSGAGA